MAHDKHQASAEPVTYTPAAEAPGPRFTCPRCGRSYPYPKDHGKPIRCECGWWYENLGHGRIVEEFRPRIGGAKTSGPEAAAGSAAEMN